MDRRLRLLLLLVLLLPTAACGSADQRLPEAPAPSAVTVTITADGFGDKQYVVPGGTVRVVNKDSTVHGLVGLEKECPDSAGDIPPGGTRSFATPTKVGAYVFTDAYVESMAGVLVVSNSAKPVPTSSFSLAPGP